MNGEKMLSDSDLVRLEKLKATIGKVPNVCYDEKYKTIDLENSSLSLANMNMPNVPPKQSDFLGNFFSGAKDDIQFLINLLENKQ